MLPWQPWLRRWLARRGVQEGDLDDLVQDTCLKLLRLETVDHIRNVRTYMLQTAWSLILQKVRRDRVVEIVNLAPEHMTMIDDQPPADARLDARRKLEIVLAGLDALPERTRTVLLARRLQGASLRDTAAIVGVSQSAVEKQLRSAHRKLSATLQDSGGR